MLSVSVRKLVCSLLKVSNFTACREGVTGETEQRPSAQAHDLQYTSQVTYTNPTNSEEFRCGFQ